MRRNKFEIEALVDLIKGEIKKVNKAKTNTPEFRKKVEEQFTRDFGKIAEEFKKLITERAILNKKIQTITELIHKKTNLYSYEYNDMNINEKLSESIRNKIANITKVTDQEIFNQIVLAEDQGAEIIVKKLTKLYV